MGSSLLTFAMVQATTPNLRGDPLDAAGDCNILVQTFVNIIANLLEKIVGGYSGDPAPHRLV